MRPNLQTLPISSPDLADSSKRIPLRGRLAWIAIAVAFVLLMLVRQPLYPAPWFDEGLNVSAAAMLARNGQYALPDSDGPRIMDPAIQTGPTIIVPIALTFRLFGFDIVPARLAMLPFAAITLISYALLSGRLMGQAVAGLATLFLIIGNRAEFASFISMSRQVLGEVPALGFHLLGVLIWLSAVQRGNPSPWRLVLSGLAWGSAMVTKSQALLLLPVSFGLLAIADRLYYRQASWRAFLVPGSIAIGCVLVWFAVQFTLAGPEQFRLNAQILREGVTLHIVGINPVHWRNALGVWWHTGWWLWGAPGLVWGLFRARQRNLTGFSHAVALSLPLVGSIWFTGLSVGWERYAFYTLVLSPMWTAGMLLTLGQSSSRFLRPERRAHALIIGLIIAYAAINGWSLAYGLATAADSGYQAMRNYLATKIPHNATIESWEWEISLDARQPIHHPSTSVTNAFTDYVMNRREPPACDLYDCGRIQAEFVLEGAFSSWTGIYRDVISARGEAVAAFGVYGLFHLRHLRSASPATTHITTQQD